MGAGSWASVNPVEGGSNGDEFFDFGIVTFSLGKALEPIERGAAAPFIRALVKDITGGAAETLGFELVE